MFHSNCKHIWVTPATTMTWKSNTSLHSTVVIKLLSHISKFVFLKTSLRDSRVGTMLSTFSILPAGCLIDSDSTENKGMLGGSRSEKGRVPFCLLSVPVNITSLVDLHSGSNSWPHFPANLHSLRLSVIVPSYRCQHQICYQYILNVRMLASFPQEPMIYCHGTKLHF